MTDDTATQVVLYTDQSFVADGLALAFNSRPGLHLVASYSRLSDAVAFVQSQRTDILLLDLTEEVTTPVLHTIRRIDPRCHTVLWASAITRELAYQAMEAGVRAILRKSTAPQKFLTALEAVRQGELQFEKEVLECLVTGKRVVLTVREGQLVSLLSQGLRNKEIAWTLQISEGTVKVYLSRLFKKLGVSDRFELALYGLKNMQTGFLNSTDHNDPKSLVRSRANLMSLRSILLEEHETSVHSSAYAPAPARFSVPRTTN